jgi:hypothetical protein
MGTTFWLKRFVSALLIAAAALFAAGLIKGHAQAQAARFALLWGALTAGLFTLISYSRFKRNPTCWLPPPDDSGPAA